MKNIKKIKSLLATTSHWNGGVGLIVPEWLAEKAKEFGIKISEKQIDRNIKVK